MEYRIKWTEDMSVKNFILDEEHKNLINLINLFINYNSNYENSQIDEYIQTLEKLICDHFYHEEKAFEKINFIHANQHIKDHNNFKLIIFKVIKDYRMFGRQNLIKLPKILGRWLINHTLNEDIKYRGLISENDILF